MLLRGWWFDALIEFCRDGVKDCAADANKKLVDDQGRFEMLPMISFRVEAGRCQGQPHAVEQWGSVARQVSAAQRGWLMELGSR